MTDRIDGVQTESPSSESLPSSSEQAQILVDRLTDQFAQARLMPKGEPLIDHLKNYEDLIDTAHAYFSRVSQTELVLTYASEWVLDNYYIIRQAIRQVREDLPSGYYNELPKLTQFPFKQYPRIYAIIHEILASYGLTVNEERLQEVLREFQDRASLTMGEVWAVPIFLRFDLIGTLAHALNRIIPENIRKQLPTSDTLPDLDEEEIVANAVIGLRTVADMDWKDFFENVSLIEQRLRADPARIYPHMDFKTRDIYRAAIEEMAFESELEESAITQTVLDLAAEANQAVRHQTQAGKDGGVPASDISWQNRSVHVGFYLIGDGRQMLEKRLDFTPGRWTRIKRWTNAHATPVYLSVVLLLTTLLVTLSGYIAISYANSLMMKVLIPLMLAVPALSVSTSLVNWLITTIVSPTTIPKLEFDEKVPQPFETLVVIPALLTNREETESLVQQLEMHYLRNTQPGLHFALLTDFGDAQEETREEDEDLVNLAVDLIQELNHKYYSNNRTGQFYFFHRRRTWNDSENAWMGWERKRGKLHELNQMLLKIRNGEEFDDLSFMRAVGDLPALQSVRYVITLDADTILPSGAAVRLVGAMAHPLNQPLYSSNGCDIDAGYTIMQPRMEIDPGSANRSWFTRIFSGDTGLDLYSLAVSDAYQDFFGEGIYVGKGIYDVDAYERTTKGRIPENMLLSHDLLEGLFGRAGLVTDITMVEDYPEHYFLHAMRQHRWIRGDWQLLPWLFNPARYQVRLSGLDRWKIIDNLRRSLLSPSLFLLFILGLFFLPGPAWIWTAIVLLTPGVSIITGLVRGTFDVIHGEKVRNAFRPLRLAFLRWLYSIAFLGYEAYLAVDAIGTTLYRMVISHRDRLRWTSAAHTVELFRQHSKEGFAWREMGASFLFSLALAALIYLVRPSALPAAGPVLILWTISPPLIRWSELPLVRKQAPLTVDQERLVRLVARRTWSFFERFAGPEEHWLPPDHFQESPLGVVAHRTSPTNIGLLLTSTLAAYDLGYIDQLGLVARLTATFDTIGQLDRYRGHLLNWYDTLTLQPLQPRYVSTVDSGNLAACLIITAQACDEMKSFHVFRWHRWEGYLDTLAILEDTISRLILPGVTAPIIPILDQLTDLRERIDDVRDHTEQWYMLFYQITNEIWPRLSGSLLQIIESGQSSFSMESLRSLQQVSAQVERNHQAAQRTIQQLVPWIPLLENLPELFKTPSDRMREILDALREGLPYSPILGKIRELPEIAIIHIDELRNLVRKTQASETAIEEALNWLDELDVKILDAAANVNVLLSGYLRIAQQAERWVNEMDFQFLYQPQRRVFHIGYNLDASQLDNNFYDLLASEARIASLIAIARGQIPKEHWLHLARPVTQVDGLRVLLSWSATMFEYLMPSLFLHSYEDTLLDESARGAIEHQIHYARGKGLPWGISESGFYRFDANQSYQYRAFGVPGLGFKRGLGDDIVIAPYASLIGLPLDPQEVYKNIVQMIDYGILGLYGFYEAIDFTSSRLPVAQDYAIVREYMSHHQGMVLMAAANYFYNNSMVERMHADPHIRSVELLLQEKVPLSSPTLSPEAEDIKGIERVNVAPVELDAWAVPVITAIPQAHLLANSSYSVLIDNAGAGYNKWQDLDLTRWHPDRVLDQWGTWIYIQDLDMDPRKGGLWSLGYQPIPGNPENFQVTYFHHMAVFRRIENGIISTMEITVPPEDSMEIRRLHIANTGDQPRRLRLTSYGEVILSEQAGDNRHPAFNKLFIESEYLPEQNLLVFWRRPRSGKEIPVFLGHMLILFGDHSPDRSYESDRYQFIGRGQNLRHPQALVNEAYLSGSVGATLDPIFALGQQVVLGPRESIQIAFLTLAAGSRTELMETAERYRSPHLIDRSYYQADIANQSWLGQHNIGSRQLGEILQVLSTLVFPSREARAEAKTLAANRLGQPGLWRFGVSGDFPILLIQLDDPTQLDLVQTALDAHRYLRTRRFKVDLVILNRQHTNYGAELNGMLYRLISRVNSDQWLNQRGGIFVLYADQMRPEERILLEASARLVLDGERGTLGSQLPGYAIQVPHLPDFISTRSQSEAAARPDPLPPLPDLQFHNGFGGFSPDGREYIIDLPTERWTPAPWINVIGYPDFGFLVTESGSSNTWAINSGENRLTPWSNDPVRDPTGEALYLRDEETGQFWTPTPLPAGTDKPYRTTHGAGYTFIEHNSHGLRQQLWLYAVPDEPVKIIKLRLENILDRPRRITATQYIEWVLGTTRQVTRQYIISEYDTTHECLLASNPYNEEFGERVAFLAASRGIHGLTADRTEFIGRNGSLANPAALRRIGLQARTEPGEDPCGVLQVHIDIPPGGTDEVYFLLGQGQDREHSLSLVERYHNPDQIATAWEHVTQTWDELLGRVQVHTPDPAIDLMLNRWLLYQALSCRIWGRSAFYQSSGAYGFRDQLQDVLSVLRTHPSIAREQILVAAAHQFEAGDVLHWWHPPSGRGVRTRFSDDLLWLPYVVSHYLDTTEDWEILNEQIPFLQGPELKEGEDERYGAYEKSRQPFSLFEHCRRAIDKGSTRGLHNLPLIGTGDWNDGMNRVGEGGRGESVWLAWFLYDVLQRFTRVSEHIGEETLAAKYRIQASELSDAIEQSAWDGKWYRRAYYDDGTPLGSHLNDECQIDTIAQAWSVLSRAGKPERAEKALESVIEHLVRSEDRLLLLFTPPFNLTDKDPGYIKGYLPGIRENGGQYTHAAIWTVWAFAEQGDGQRTGELFRLLNPIYHADTEKKAQVYRVEPYVIAADVYSVPPYVRRGGWTWYTGSSGWMYQLGINAFLGFEKSGDKIRFRPSIPQEWEGFTLDYHFGKSIYHFKVHSPLGAGNKVDDIHLDGHPVNGEWLTLVDDQAEHVVVVTMG